MTMACCEESDTRHTGVCCHGAPSSLDTRLLALSQVGARHSRAMGWQRNCKPRNGGILKLLT
jgi:hypothetical protein